MLQLAIVGALSFIATTAIALKVAAVGCTVAVAGGTDAAACAMGTGRHYSGSPSSPHRCCLGLSKR